MIKIGIIGALGSGKSYVARKFGFPVFNADIEVKKIYKKNKLCFKKLKKKFPNHIYSFPIKKGEIIKIITENKSNLEKINKIVHPIVRKRMHKFLKKNKNKKMVILDIPLLLENKISFKNFYLIFVKTDKKELKNRLKKRKNYNSIIINKLKKFQLSEKMKIKKSNYIIKNNFKKNSLKKDVEAIKNKILKL